MRLNADNKYYEQNECPVCEVDPFTECKGSQALKDVGVTWQGDFELDMSLKNITDYSPTWPQAKGDDPQELEKMGYLYNGGKADGALADDLLQVNLCSGRWVQTEMCFTTKVADETRMVGFRNVPVKMRRVAIRVFDIDHSSGMENLRGPEAFQFNCSGGTFSLFGESNEHPYVSYNAGEPVINETWADLKGNFKKTYLCPDNDEPVTVWSRKRDVPPPTSSDLASLSKEQEQAMVLIEYVGVECMRFTLASMPHKYQQQAYSVTDSSGMVHEHAAWPLKKASEGGNPLNTSKPLRPAETCTDEAVGEDFCDLTNKMCEPAGGGRNWLLAGYAPEETTAPCDDVSIANDPMFVVNGLHRHFWLPSGENTPLLRWEAGGAQFVLKGETFGEGHSQWFGSFSLTADHKEVVRVTIADEPLKLVRRTHGGRKLKTLEVWIGGHRVESSAGGELTLEGGQNVSALANSLPELLVGQHTHAESVEIRAPGLKLSVSSASAKKYDEEADKVRWAHLNMRMLSNVPFGATDMIAELAGIRPLSERTKRYLAVPRDVQEHRWKKRLGRRGRGEASEQQQGGASGDTLQLKLQRQPTTAADAGEPAEVGPMLLRETAKELGIDPALLRQQQQQQQQQLLQGDASLQALLPDLDPRAVL